MRYRAESTLRPFQGKGHMSACQTSSVSTENCIKALGSRLLSTQLEARNMRKHVLLYLMITLAITFTAQARSDRSDDIHRIEESAQIFQEIMQTPDKAIPQYLLDSAQCIAIIPSEMKLAFIVGANYGKGLVTCRGTKSWSAPVFLSISGGSFGFQIGGSSTDIILVFRGRRGLQKLL